MSDETEEAPITQETGTGGRYACCGKEPAYINGLPARHAEDCAQRTLLKEANASVAALRGALLVARGAIGRHRAPVMDPFGDAQRLDDYAVIDAALRNPSTTKVYARYERMEAALHDIANRADCLGNCGGLPCNCVVCVAKKALKDP